MTESLMSLKSLLVQQAATVAFKPPDLDAIARGHHRRVRRRRAAMVLAAVAVAVVAGVAVVQLGPNGPAGRGPDVAAGPWPAGAASWALGSTIHVGDDTVDVGHDVRAYVRTSVGFVTIDSAGNVYSVTARAVTRIGRALIYASAGTDQPGLVADPGGTLAGWIGVDGSGRVLQVHDQSTGQTRAYETAGATGSGGALFFAIDDRTAYWRIETRAGVFAVDLDTGDERQLAGGDEARTLEIWSVEDGVLAFSRNHQPDENVTSISVGRSIDDSREFTFGEHTEAHDDVRLSPTGAFVSYLLYEFDGPPSHDKVLGIRAQVRHAVTGDLVTLDLPAGAVAVPVVWLDEHTLQVLALGPAPGQGDLYACAVPGGSCAVAADLPAAATEGNALVLPTGRFLAP
jgi:hypothetical protein